MNAGLSRARRLQGGRELACIVHRAVAADNMRLPDPVDALLEIDRDAYAAYLREKMRQAGL